MTLTGCPTPIGLGETLQKAYVGHDNGGSCALAKGTTTREAAIVTIKSKAISVAIVLLLIIAIFLSPLIFSKNHIDISFREVLKNGKNMLL